MNIKLLRDLDFPAKINSGEAVTEAGKELLAKYRAYCYSNAPTCGVVNGFIGEASKYGFDTGLVNILDSVNTFVTENNISWKLASACESIQSNTSSQAYISKFAVGNVQKLIEMNEADVVSYIKAGALKSVQYVPEFRQICRDVYKAKVNEAQSVSYTVTNPVSYVYVNEAREQFFTVLGRTFKVADGKVCESQCDEPVYTRMNQLLSSFKKAGDDIFFEMKGMRGEAIRFTLSNQDEPKLTFTKGEGVNEEFKDSVKFMEYANMLSRTMMMNEKMTFMNVAKNVADVFENLDNVVALDCAKVVNAANGTILAVIEGKDNVNLTVARSVNAGTSCINYDYVVEALNQVTKLTGVDIKCMYEDRINEDCKKSPEYNEVVEQITESKKAQMDMRRRRIVQLAEQFKNDPVRIALLNKAAKDLAVLENVNEHINS